MSIFADMIIQASKIMEESSVLKFLKTVLLNKIDKFYHKLQIKLVIQISRFVFLIFQFSSVENLQKYISLTSNL